MKRPTWLFHTLVLSSARFQRLAGGYLEPTLYIGHEMHVAGVSMSERRSIFTYKTRETLGNTATERGKQRTAKKGGFFGMHSSPSPLDLRISVFQAINTDLERLTWDDGR